MLKVGLTGSIAVGKSYVLGIFSELGCFVLDADKTSREVVEPGSTGLAEIVEHFGSDILSSDGTLNRGKLASIVFDSDSKRALLNSIVHPRVFEAQNSWLAEVEKKNPKGIAIVDAALMIESGGYKRFDKLIVIWCQPDVQLSRLLSRGGLSEDEARKRITAQMPQDEKKKYADFLIDTSKGYEDTRRQTAEVFHELELLT